MAYQVFSVEQPQGLNTDLPNREIKPSVWTDGKNIDFPIGKTRKRAGYQEALFGWNLVGAKVASSPTGGNGTIGSLGTGTDTTAQVYYVVCTALSSPVGSETWTVYDAAGYAASPQVSMGTATTGVAYADSQVAFTITDTTSSPRQNFIVGDTFTITVTKDGPLGDINHLLPWRVTAGNYWIYSSLTNIYEWDGTNHTDVTSSASPTTSGISWTCDADVPITSTVIGDVCILNNGQDIPVYRLPTDSTFSQLPNTGQSPAGTWPSNLTCRSMRSFKQYLIALNLTEGATAKPQTLRWSTAADPNSLPTWDVVDAASDSGENTLSATDGRILDGLTLGDQFVIYKDDAVFGMRLIGGQFVFSFNQLFADVGLLATNCVAAFEGKHFVVGPNDIYIHNGASKQSVIDGVMRDTIYKQIDDNKLDRSFCVANYRNNEIWFCFCNAGDESTYPNRALVYNWTTETLTFRDIPSSAHISYGEVADTPQEVADWDTDGGTWDEDFSTWGEVSGKPTERRLVIPDTANNALYADGRGNDDNGTAFTAYVERLGMDFGDPNSIKHIYAFRPYITGSGDVTITLYGEEDPGSGYSTFGSYTYTIGQQYKIDCRGFGRFIGVRIESSGSQEWEVSSYNFDYMTSGDY